jgi:hypothetical protein
VAGEHEQLGTGEESQAGQDVQQAAHGPSGLARPDGGGEGSRAWRLLDRLE